MTRILNKVIFTVLVVILSIAILSTLGLRLIGFQFRAVTTGSMEPDLPVGSLLLIRKVSFGSIKIGDDITFVRDENLTVTTHRVEEINTAKKRFITKGIVNNTADAPVSYENVLGKVVFCLPKIGYSLTAMETTQNRIIGITVIAVLVIVWMILGVLSKGKEKSPIPAGISGLTPNGEGTLYDWLQPAADESDTWLNVTVDDEGTLGVWFDDFAEPQ